MSRVRHALFFGVTTAFILVASLAGSAAAHGAGWSAPHLISAHNYVSGDYDSNAVSLAVDLSGKLHGAVRGVNNTTDGIWYVTNKSGTWKMTQAVGAPKHATGRPPHYDDPSISVDLDGSVSIAFTRNNHTDLVPGPSLGVFLVSKSGASWSQPGQIGNPKDWSGGPSLVVRDGRIYLAYDISNYVRETVRYVTTDGSSSDSKKLLAAKSGADLLVDAHGNPRLLAVGKHGTLLFWNGSNPTSLGTPQTIPAGSGKAEIGKAALDAKGRPTVAWSAYNKHTGKEDIFVSSRRHGTWKSPVLLPDSGRVAGVAVDSNGVTHVLAIREDGALVYFSDRSGPWTEQQLYGSDVVSAALVVDHNNRPRVMFAVDKPNPDFGLYYMGGPSS